jgi:hypothetical protein
VPLHDFCPGPECLGMPDEGFRDALRRRFITEVMDNTMQQELIIYPSLTLLALVGTVIGLRIVSKIRHENRRSGAVQCTCQKLDLLAGRILQTEAQTHDSEEVGTIKRDFLSLCERRDLFYEQGGTLEEWEELSGETDTLSARVASACGPTKCAG